MLKTVIVLPDGTELSSGGHAINAIKSATVTECVNSGEELTIGSACANALEATLFAPKGGLAVAAGAEVTVYKEDPTGSRKPVGIFILEKPTRPSANTMKLTGYDRVSKLDKDLTAWLSGLTEWPYKLTAFAGMVCEACGLTLKKTEVPNGDFQVQQFTRSSVTGRQIMRWLGEICCRFCRATTEEEAEGEIEFAWYTDSGKTITSSGDPYYFQNGLTYEDFSTAPIDAVQLRLADSEDGALWPEAGKGANSYIITGNPILNARISSGLEGTLNAIKAELAGVSYTPCKVEIPANMDIRAGNTVEITDKNGKTFTAFVMTKTQTGQKDTLECTGSPRRDSATAMNNQSSSSKAEAAAGNAFAGMTQEQIFLKLTNNGKLKGLFMQDGELYVNASFLKSGEIDADMLKTGTIKSKDGKIAINLSGGSVKFLDGIVTNGLSVTDEDSGNVTLLKVYARNSSEGKPFLNMEVKSANGSNLMRITEHFNPDTQEPNGASIELENHSGDYKVVIDASDGNAGISLWKGNSGKGVVSINENGEVNISPHKIMGETARWTYFSDLGCYVLTSGL